MNGMRGAALFLGGGRTASYAALRNYLRLARPDSVCHVPRIEMTEHNVRTCTRSLVDATHRQQLDYAVIYLDAPATNEFFVCPIGHTTIKHTEYQTLVDGMRDETVVIVCSERFYPEEELFVTVKQRDRRDEFVMKF